MKRVLMTGVGGFIGSHFLSHFLVNTDWDIVGTDSWRHKGISERITHNKHYQDNKSRVKIYTHDLTTPFSTILKQEIGEIDYIVNLASESHVDRSISDPAPFVRNNVDVVLTMLELAREIKPEKFIQIGTDEVYGATDETTAHKEWEVALPSNPYAASKACQEAIAISYWRTYGVPVILTNTMNNFAEMQDGEKFLPMIIRKIQSGETLEVHADPTLTKSGSRYWLHARNHADAVLFLLNSCDPKMYPKFGKPERVNIVGDRRISNLELAQTIATILGKPLNYKLTDAHSQRMGHDLHYGLDGGKLHAMGYAYPKNFEESLVRTVKWTIENPNWMAL